MIPFHAVLQIGYNPIESAMVMTYADKYTYSSVPVPEMWHVGSVEFCRVALGDKEPKPVDYPQPIRASCKRKVEPELSPVRWSIRDQTQRFFCKPVKTKEWPARIFEIDETPQSHFWYSEVVEFVAEWRVYFFDDNRPSICRYDDGDEIHYQENQRAIFFATELATDWRVSGTAPCAFALDVGLLKDGRMALVEANDFWALGYYPGCDKLMYTRSLHKRWCEMTTTTGET
jgi:hypothetical protein